MSSQNVLFPNRHVWADDAERAYPACLADNCGMVNDCGMVNQMTPSRFKTGSAWTDFPINSIHEQLAVIPLYADHHAPA
jgi:hypothetical protein